MPTCQPPHFVSLVFFSAALVQPLSASPCFHLFSLPSHPLHYTTHLHCAHLPLIRPPCRPAVRAQAAAARQPPCLPTVAGGTAGLVSHHCTRQAGPGGATLASCVLGGPLRAGPRRQLVAVLRPPALAGRPRCSLPPFCFFPASLHPFPTTPSSAPSTLPVSVSVRDVPRCPLHGSFPPSAPLVSRMQSPFLPLPSPMPPAHPLCSVMYPLFPATCYMHPHPLTPDVRCMTCPACTHPPHSSLPHQVAAPPFSMQLWPAPSGSALVPTSARSLHHRVAASGLLPTTLLWSPHIQSVKSFREKKRKRWVRLRGVLRLCQSV